MIARANPHDISLKKSCTLHKEKVNTINQKVESKRNQNQKNRISKKEIETNINSKKPQSKDLCILNSKEILKNSPRHKRNHSQLDMSSSFLDLQNDNEFEQQIQNKQANLSPGVTIGRDGKSPVNPTFVKKKIQRHVDAI